MKKIATFITALAATLNATTEIRTEVRVVYENPEQVPEHTWDTDLYLKGKEGYSSHMEFLYWTVVEGGMEYAIKMNHPGGSTPGAIGYYKNSTFDVDPGFRLGASFFRAPHYWELWGQYTRLTSHGSNHVTAPTASGEYLNGVWPVASANEPLIKASSSTHFNYNLIDVYFDRVFQPNPHLRLRMLGGITGTWMSQEQNIKYIGSSNSTTFVRNQWKYGGCGLRCGLDGDWYWFGDFYMTSQFTAAALIGPYRNQNYLTSSTETNPLQNSIYTDTRPALNFQLVLGPSYQKVFKNSRIELFAGYESNIWTNLQEVYHTTQGTPIASKELWINSGVITLFGLTTRLTIAY